MSSRDLHQQHRRWSHVKGSPLSPRPLRLVFFLLCIAVLWRSACNFFQRRRPTEIDITSQPWSHNVIVSERSRLIFCPIPKAANTNWKYVIRKWEGLEDYASVRAAHDPYTSGLRYLSDYSAREARTIVTRFYKFAFVRDPYLRALSAYMDKLRNTDPRFVREEYRTFLAALLGWHRARAFNDDAPRPSFATFVNALAQTPRDAMNAHWRPQTDLCGFDEMHYDFIGRMEKLRADAQTVFAALNRSNERFPSHDDVGFPPSGASNELADEMYTLDLMFKVRVIYERDFAVLGY